LQDEKIALTKESKDFIENQITKIKSKKNETRVSISPLNDDLNNKNEKVKDLKDRLEIARAELDEKKKVFEVQVTFLFSNNVVIRLRLSSKVSMVDWQNYKTRLNL